MGTQPNFTQNWTSDLECSLQILFPAPIERPFLAVEIGCFEGRGSLMLAALLCGHPESRLHCIDPWEDVYVRTDQRFNTPQINDMCVGQYERFLQNTAPNPKIVPLRGLSDDRIPDLPSELDFAYIDGDHTPEQVYKDGANVLAKMRDGGVILFDDYLFSYNGIETRDGIDRFCRIHADCTEVLITGAQVAVRKVGASS